MPSKESDEVNEIESEKKESDEVNEIESQEQEQEQEQEQKNKLKNKDVDLAIESEDENEEEENIKVLNLSNQELIEIPEDISQKKGANVTILILTKNKLKTLKNLEFFPNLETLQLDRNGLQNLSDLPKLAYLKTLWLNNNELSDLNQLLKILLKQCPRLTYLSLLRNLVCPSVYFDHGNESRYKRYRHCVLYNLKGLTYLDTTKVTSDERQEAEAKGKFLVVKRPDQENEENALKKKNEDQAEIIANEEAAYNDAALYKHAEPAAFLGKGKLKYDGRESEGNRFILNTDL